MQYENFVPIVVPGLSTSSSSSSPSSTSMTPSRQEIDHPTSSSSSSTSPTTTASSDSETREREDQSEIDSPPVPVSSSNVDDRTVKPVVRSETIHERSQANQKSPKTNKKETTIERGNPLFADSGRAALSSEIPECLQECRENLVDDRVPEHGDSHASSSHEVLWNPHPREVRIWVKHSVYTHFPEDRNCEICQRTKITRAPCRRRNGGAVPRAENFGDLITADHKVLSENCESRNNHRYAIVVQDLATQWIQSYPCKTKTSEETQRSLQKFLEPNRTPTVIHTENSLEFGKAWEDLSWNHCTSIRHRSETTGIAERAVRRVNENWWADSMERYTNLRHVQDLLSDGKPHMRDVLGNHLKDRLFHLVHWLSITLSLQRTSQESINLERKSYLDCSSDTHCTRGEFGRVTYWLQTWRSWKRWTHQKSTQKRLSAKDVIFPREKGKFIFPIADGRIKPLGGDQDLRTPTLIRHRPIRGESHVDFLGESEGSLPPPHESFPDAGEAINDFWSMSGNFIFRHHVEPRVKLYSPREESFPIPLKYIDVFRTTHANLDVKQEKRRIDDYWNIDGPRDLSDSWTGFTHFTPMEEKPPDGYMWSWRRLTRKQLTSRPDPELWEKMGKNAKLKEKQAKVVQWKPQLDNARKLRGIYFIDPEDKEFKETIKNARKKLETPMAPAMPCKINKKKYANVDKSNNAQSKL